MEHHWTGDQTKHLLFHELLLIFFFLLQTCEIKAFYLFSQVPSPAVCATKTGIAGAVHSVAQKTKKLRYQKLSHHAPIRDLLFS